MFTKLYIRKITIRTIQVINIYTDCMPKELQRKRYRCLSMAFAPGGGGVLPYIDYMGMCRWPGYGFQAFEFRTGYINQENDVRNRVYNYIKLINSLIQVATNFLERHMDTYRIHVILSSALIRVSSLEQGIKTKLNLV